MNRVQRITDWLGQIYFEPEAVAWMAKDLDDKKVAQMGLTKQQAVERIGVTPSMKKLLDRHYDSAAARKLRRSEGDPPLTSEYSVLTGESGENFARIRIVTHPREGTTVSIIGPDEPRHVM